MTSPELQSTQGSSQAGSGRIMCHNGSNLGTHLRSSSIGILNDGLVSVLDLEKNTLVVFYMGGAQTQKGLFPV